FPPALITASWERRLCARCTLFGIAKQFIDADLFARLRIDALHDDRGVEAVFAVARRQRARHDDGAGRHAAAGDLVALAVVNARALADVDAHRHDRAALDDHALDDFRARADEAIVLDDRRRGLQRFEHAADADAARDVYVRADLRA